MIHPHHIEQAVIKARIGRDLDAAADMTRVRHREQRGYHVPLLDGAVRPGERDVIPIAFDVRQLDQNGHEIAQRTARKPRMVGSVVDARVETARQHAGIQPVTPAIVRPRHTAHIDIDMRAAHDGTNDAFDCGLHPVDRQFEATGEIIAGADRDDAERLAAGPHRVDTQHHHAVAADHHEIVVGWRGLTRFDERIVETAARQIDDIETMNLAALD